MTTDPDRCALPAVLRDSSSSAFFDATEKGDLLILRCAMCEAMASPTTRTCPDCGGNDFDPHVSNGWGTLVSWTTVAHAPMQSLAASIPYVAGIVELDEGPWLFSRLHNLDPESAAVGLRVAVRFVRSGGPEDDAAEVIPTFTPA